jgi:hypothetical protein
VLTLFIDLILLKRGVYRHLLYNRGTPPRRVVGQTKDEEGDVENGSSENEREIVGRMLHLTWCVLSDVVETMGDTQQNGAWSRLPGCLCV